MNLKTIPSVLAAGLALELGLVTAAPFSIGVAVTRGSFRVDEATVSANATLLEGTSVETGEAPASLLLTSGTHLALEAQSKGRIFGDHLLLEKGSGEIERPVGYRVEARGLTIRPQNGIASARVTLLGAHQVRVAAFAGSFRVTNANGMAIADLPPGAALEFDPQAGAEAPEPWRLTGCVMASAGHFLLTDETTNLTVEISGAGLDKETGNRLEVTGTRDAAATPVSGASQLIRVSHFKRLSNKCGGGKKAPAAAAAGGAAAGVGATVAGISTTTVVIVGGVAAGAAVGGLAAAKELPGQGGSTNSTSR